MDGVTNRESDRTRTGTTILHADLDAFYASVEQNRDPSLRGKTVIVGDGVVLAASYEAREFGVRSGMGGGEARRRCPDATWVSPDFSRYAEMSKRVMAIFRDVTPLVEQLSPDEAFLDVAGARRLFGDPTEIAAALRSRVKTDTGLVLSVGVARTKFLAKVASGVAKPDGLILVEPEDEMDFLHPLPVGRLWGVGSKTEAKLQARGIRTVGDFAGLPADALGGLVGCALGSHLHALGSNIDDRQVETHRSNHSIGSQQALGRVSTVERVGEVLLALADRVTTRMRRSEQAGRTLTVRLRFADDFSTITRSLTLPFATDSSSVVRSTAESLVFGVVNQAAEEDLKRAEATEADRMEGADLRLQSVLERRGVSLLGVSVSHLSPSSELQMELPFETEDSSERMEAHVELDRAVDEIRDRFGHDAIGSARLAKGEAPIAPSWADLEAASREETGDRR